MFQPTRSRGARPPQNLHGLPAWRFKPTRSRGARRSAAQRLEHGRQVSTHALTRSATERAGDIECRVRVSTHALTRSATLRGCRGCPTARRFNPRAHAERDRNGRSCRRRSKVSTHALTRSATGKCWPRRSFALGFQPTRSRGARPDMGAMFTTLFAFSTHALTRSATGACSGLPAMPVFQPTRSRGARPRCRRPRWAPGVSTHALTRSATAAGIRRCPCSSVSTHALTRSATELVGLRPSPALRFQPTRSRGARLPCTYAGQRTQRRFNPRAHAERDQRLARHAQLREVQPTRSRGARQVGRWSCPSLPARSTHSLTRSATGALDPRRHRLACFNPRAHAERDAEGWVRSMKLEQFQPTRSRGARRIRTRVGRRIPAGFNPRAHAERDMMQC